MGVQHRLILDFPGGAGYVGIAVALMGRNHPVGIVLAASCSARSTRAAPSCRFDMPALTRDMVVVIQGLVILFCGALEQPAPAALEALFAPPARRALMRA